MSEPFQPPDLPEASIDDDDDDEAFDEEDFVEEDFVEEAAEPAEDVNRVTGGTAQAVLEHVARSIVEEPEAVVIEASESRGQTRLSLHVAPGDMGRVIGKRGRVAQAIRAVVRAAAARDGADASVDIVD
ncbi:MAG TPA: KH domain-containing protein [Acidimicrobiales bacterium]|nr:KH domain-containing protein [Acidimicrobiales bacterium]